MKTTKKSLLASGLALLICVALLVGTTFAWFTDSVSNKGNSIQAGSLLINAYAYDLGTGGQTCTIPGVNNGQAFTFEATAQDLKTDATPIISEQIWEPGVSSAKLLQVTNNGTLAAKIKLQFTTSGDLTDALWFDFIQIDDTGAPTGTFTQRPMSTLATFAENLELPLDAGATVRFVLVYGMNTGAGREYMDDTFTADVTILATQNTKEADGFGNTDYDEPALYPAVQSVDNADDLEDLLTQPGVPTEITLTQSLTNVKLPDITGDVTMNLGKNMLSSSSTPISGAPIDIADGGSLTINAEANSYGFDYTAGGLTAAGEGFSLTVNGGRYGVSGASGAEVTAKDGAIATINDGIFSSSGFKGHALMATNQSTIYVNGGRFSCSGADSTLMFADGGTIIVEDCEISSVNGKRFAAANGGQILVSKTYSPSQPTSIASGCNVAEQDQYWVIFAE